VKDLTKKKVSEFKSRQEWEEYLWLKIVEKFSAKKSQKETAMLLKNLFSTHERNRMIKRAVAISLIAQGKSYNEISKILWISPNTINSLKKGLLSKAGYTSRYTRVKSREKKPKLLSKKEFARLRIKLWFEGLFILPGNLPRISLTSKRWRL